MPAGKTKKAKEVWFALADEERCRLLRASLTPRGSVHVDELDHLENPHARAPRGRPQALGGMTGHSYAEPPDKDADRTRRFCGDLTEWLGQRCRSHKADQVILFVPSKVLGLLRRAAPRFTGFRFEMREGNLVQLRPHELAEHRMIRDLVGVSGDPR